MAQIQDFEIVRHDKKYPRAEAVPAKPGIYAWFVDFSSLEKSLDDTVEFVQELKILVNGLAFPSLEASLSSNWNVHFKGTIRHIINSQATSSLFVERETRRNFVEIAKKFGPLGSPLYIGITTRTLRIRYEEHLSAYLDAKLNKLFNDKSLGARLAERGIPIRYLSFGWVQLDESVAMALKTTETILNNLFKPVLGRK